MPPKAAVVAASPSPPPVSPNDSQDILIIADMIDTFDQIPAELTRVHSDLNELAAVLYATLVTLEGKLNQLVEWIQDPSIGPEKRFQLLQEIAEEAARYKLGGDDKIRVAGGACDGLVQHQKHISNLLEASTLLASAPPSPYTQALTIPSYQPPTYTRRGVLARAANSPFGGRGYAAAAGGTETVKERDTPSKKKKSRVAQLGVRDDDDVSVGGSKKVPAKKRKPTNRAVSPTDSLASTSAFTGKPVEPRTARQLAAAANRARAKVEAADDDSDMEDQDEDMPGPSVDSQVDKNGLGLDVGGHTRENTGASKTSNASAGASRPTNRGRGSHKRARDDEEDDGRDDEEGDQKSKKPAGKKAPQGMPPSSPVAFPDGDDNDEGEGETHADMQPYCICQKPSYGEMIGCDNDDCDIEWFHLSCLGLDTIPGGDWTCPKCTEKKKNNSKKKSAKSKGRK